MLASKSLKDLAATWWVGEQGVVLVTALLVMLLLMPLGALFLGLSVTESRIASNEVVVAKAFSITEAGIEHAKRAVVPLNLSDVLGGTIDVFPGGNTVSLAGGSYTVQVMNNIPANGFPLGTIPADTSGSATVDGDRILVVSSTGSFRAGQKTLGVVIRVPTPVVGAVYVMDGTDTAPTAELEDLGLESSISGMDCNPPSAGGGLGPGPHLPAIATQSAQAKSDIEGDIGVANPQVYGVHGDGDIEVVLDAMSDADLEAWVNTLFEAATPFGTGACGGPANSLQFGTWDQPQICWGTGNMTMEIPDGSSGAGILIFDDFTAVGLTPGAEARDFTYEGLVIVLGDGRFRLRGHSKIYGAVVQKNVTSSHSGETRLRLRDGSDICYSSMAVQAAQETVGPGQLAWYESFQ